MIFEWLNITNTIHNICILCGKTLIYPFEMECGICEKCQLDEKKTIDNNICCKK